MLQTGISIAEKSGTALRKALAELHKHPSQSCSRSLAI